MYDESNYCMIDRFRNVCLNLFNLILIIFTLINSSHIDNNKTLIFQDRSIYIYIFLFYKNTLYFIL